MLQVFLTQARGARRNGDLLRQSFDLMVRMRAQRDNRRLPEVIDNTLIEMLSTLTAALEEEGIVYAVTGSVASSRYGEPRMTQDVDIVLFATADEIARVGTRLRPRFYAPSDTLAAAAQSHDFANVVDNATGLKADLSFLPAKGFQADAVRRRERIAIGTGGPQFWFVTAEDIILMKLNWRRETQSPRQWDDALSVARVQGARMDWRYLFEQAERLRLKEDLERLRDEARI
jgi:hypothetical protein